MGTEESSIRKTEPDPGDRRERTQHRQEHELALHLIFRFHGSLKQDGPDDFDSAFGSSKGGLQLLAHRAGGVSVERSHYCFDIAAGRPAPRHMHEKRRREHGGKHKPRQGQSQPHTEAGLTFWCHCKLYGVHAANPSANPDFFGS